MARFHLLLVCTGNTCRSPMAEVLAWKILEDQPGVVVGSAGVFAGVGQPASPEAVEAMKTIGLDLSQHRSQPLTPELLEQVDQIYTMTESHRQAVLAQAPSAIDKVQRLDPDADISDPFGASLPVYQETAEQIKQALEARLKQ
ncbi:MAG: low molecular weight protein arginine phosphatase [Planctomycetota bacterium]